MTMNELRAKIKRKAQQWLVWSSAATAGLLLAAIWLPSWQALATAALTGSVVLVAGYIHNTADRQARTLARNYPGLVVDL